MRKVYLEKMNNLSKHHGAGPQCRGAQCSCIGCIGLRPALRILQVKQVLGYSYVLEMTVSKTLGSCSFIQLLLFWQAQ